MLTDCCRTTLSTQRSQRWPPELPESAHTALCHPIPARDYSLLLARCAPITYVSAQLGHSKPDTMLRHYARWIPQEGQTFADLLDNAPGEDQVVEKVGTKGGHQNEHRVEGTPQPTEKKGAPCLPAVVFDEGGYDSNVRPTDSKSCGGSEPTEGRNGSFS